MRRSRAALPTAPIRPAPPSDTHQWKIALELLTPLYKGAANPNGIDPGYPVRGPSVRGQLRAWWRATTSITDVPTLRNSEADVFGAVHNDQPTASPVRVGVLDGKGTPAAKPSGLGYVLWVDRHNDPLPFQNDVSASVQIDGPVQHRDALNRAIAAWIFLGGLGSRSRRGLGAAWASRIEGLQGWDPFTGFDSVEAYLRAVSKLAPQPLPHGDRPWPSLANAKIAYGKPQRNALGALRVAIGALREFRAMRELDKYTFSGTHRPPEIQHDWGVIRDGEGTLNGTNAALGMPNAYRSSSGHFDRTRTINPKGKNRLPSPMLIRPIKIGREFVPVFVLMRGWAAPNLGVRGAHKVTGTAPRDAATGFVATQLQRLGWSIHPLGGAS